MGRTETSHFWLGRFPSAERLGAYFEETYGADRDDVPVSEFAREQGERWYDHDFLEYGFNPSAASVAELVRGYSYHEQYTAELTQWAVQLGFPTVNTLVFISESEIARPRSVEGEDYWLRYVGPITYQI